MDTFNLFYQNHFIARVHKDNARTLDQLLSHVKFDEEEFKRSHGITEEIDRDKFFLIGFIEEVK